MVENVGEADVTVIVWDARDAQNAQEKVKEI